MISPDILFNKGLTPSTFYYLYCIYLGVPFPWDIDRKFEARLLNDLVQGSWIDKELKLRPKAELLIEGSTTEVFTEFVERYLALWPTQKEAGSTRMLRASLVDCTNKFKKWFKKYKVEITSENFDIIIAVTKKYLEDQSRERYKYCMRANYFIDKDGESLLHPMFMDYESENSNTEDPFIKNI